MNSIINDKIIKYLELIDENIIVLDNFINITEKIKTCLWYLGHKLNIHIE